MESRDENLNKGSGTEFRRLCLNIEVNQLFSKLCFHKRKESCISRQKHDHLRLKNYPLPDSNSVNKYSLCVEGKFQSEAYTFLKLI